MKQIIIKSTFLLSILLVLSNCASLTKSQLSEINQFGKLTSNFSTFTSKLYPAYYEIHQKGLLYSASSYVNPEKHYDALKNAYDLKVTSDTISPKLELTLKIIDKYAQSLVLLTADNHSKQLDSATQSLDTNLEGLIGKYNKIDPTHALPKGIGTATAELITLGGKQFIRNRQAMEVKDLMTKGDYLIDQLCSSLLVYLQPKSKNPTDTVIHFLALIANERQEIKQNYISYLGLHREIIRIKDSSDSTREFTGFLQQQRFATLENDQDLLQILASLDNLSVLYGKTITAIKNLQTSHHKLTMDIRQKKKLKEFIPELREYGNDIKQLYNTLKAIK